MIGLGGSPKPPPERLELVRALVAVAAGRRADLPGLLRQSFPTLDDEEMGRTLEQALGQKWPSGLRGFGVAVWHDQVLFAVSCARQVVIALDHEDPVPLEKVGDTPYWVAVIPLTQGELHLFRFGVEGEWSPAFDVAGYYPLSYQQHGVPHGSMTDKKSITSLIYPGATTDYWMYANRGIDEVRGAPVMVWHDGPGLLEPSDFFGLRMQIVTDNLVYRGDIPPMIHVLVAPSSPLAELPTRFEGEDQSNAMRSLQYDTLSDTYGRFVLSEVLPDAARSFKLRTDAYSRGAAGASSGGICALKLAWFHPDHFARVLSTIGSFTGLQWESEAGLEAGFMLSNLVRREPRRNIRVWLSDGSNDLEVGGDGRRDLFIAGSWPLNNIQLANALKAREYDFHFRFGEGVHSLGQAALDLPESLAWLWRDYDPDRTEQIFEQDAAERAQPPYRVQIANRDAW